jgi:transcriptional regulator with XRE-family HTH domain
MFWTENTQLSANKMAKTYPKLGGILKKLLFERNMKASDLAREVNLPSPTIHRLVTGKSSRPYMSSLEPIADYFSVSIDQLLGEEDIHTKSDLSASQLICTLPLIPWEGLDNIGLGNESIFEQIPYIGSVSKRAFATVLIDTSMEPIFNRGNVLIFEPALLPKDRSYVLVRLAGKQGFIFRQLLMDADHKYLKPLNPDLKVFKMRLLGVEDSVVAVLVEARQLFS